ncbi:Papain-like cysteine protease c1 [Globisporangium polare]
MRVFRTISMVALALCGVASLAQAKSPREYESDFENWMANHHLTIRDALEYARRLENYIANDLYILMHNKEYEYTGVKLAHNEYSHLSHDEFKARMNGFEMPPGYLEGRLAKRKSNVLRDVKVPDEVDWVKKGGVTPVKNQGQCGSCWAFSTTGAVEGAAFVSDGKLPNLSEQELVDCDNNGDMGCNGGLMDHAFAWIEDNEGICSEDEYEYKAKQSTCQTCKEIVKVTGFQDVNPNDEHALQVAVAQQPVAVAIEADQRAFQFYSSGVFNLTCGTQLDHGVLAVGYGEENGQKFWRVKNSWGGSWGEQGFIRLARGLNGGAGQCGIAMAPSYPFASWIKADDEVEKKAVHTEKKAIRSEPSGDVYSSAKISQCGDKDKALITFEDLEVTQNPKRGKPITFSGNGSSKQAFDSASFKLLVKLGGQQVFGHSGKLCGETHVPLPLGLGHIDVHGFQCPMKQGEFSGLTVDVNLPMIAPSGNYEIQFLGGSAGGVDSIFCVSVGLELDNDEDFKRASVYEVMADM